MSGYPPSYSQSQGYPNDPYKQNANAAYNPSPPSGFAPPPQPNYTYGQATPMQPAYDQRGYGQPVDTQTMNPDSEAAVPKHNYEQQFGNSFSDKALRRGFIRKVYLILFTQLAVTFGVICLFIFCKPVKEFVQDNIWVYLVAYVLFIVLYITLICCPGVRRKSPGNFICLGLFTLVFSYMVGTLSSFHDTGIVLMAAGITAAVCLAISIFAMQTKLASSSQVDLSQAKLSSTNKSPAGHR
ncbi:protein lifeguard 1 [Plakobranchus ocellatus]|uniref:Protein lifeguard 1 n=1 Tax=Plakobranchus ocellatus TaxID=259542 RepID=A0AAV4E0K7_9GAST|nr:protein lifeguard 1 [Plakobranchus ocellatus]